MKKYNWEKTRLKEFEYYLVFLPDYSPSGYVIAQCEKTALICDYNGDILNQDKITHIQHLKFLTS